MHTERDVVVAPAPETATLARLKLPGARLSAEVRRDGDLTYLWLRNQVDAAQSVLLPVPLEGPPQGLSLCTRLGRWHALHWAVVFGCDAEPPLEVRFASADLRFRQEAVAVPVRLGPCWIAEARGMFATATITPAPGGPVTVNLARQW